MKSRVLMMITGAVLALTALFVLAPGALAQVPESFRTYEPAVLGRGPGGGPMQPGRGPASGPMMGSDQSLIAVAAEKLGMDRAALVAELQGGKSIAQVAQARGVAPQTIVDAFIAARTAHLDALVKTGRLTQAQADQMRATMVTRVQTMIEQPWTPQGPGARQGGGAGFVDENGDGVCDNAGTGMRQGRMGGRGGR